MGLDRIGAEPPGQRVDEVSAFADEARALEGGLAVPASGVQRPGVYGVVQHLRTAGDAPAPAHLVENGRETAVEADHQPVVAGLLDRVAHLGELLRRHGQWLFDENSFAGAQRLARSEEHTSELQSLIRLSYAVLCLK